MKHEYILLFKIIFSLMAIAGLLYFVNDSYNTLHPYMDTPLSQVSFKAFLWSVLMLITLPTMYAGFKN